MQVGACLSLSLVTLIPARKGAWDSFPEDETMTRSSQHPFLPGHPMLVLRHVSEAILGHPVLVKLMKTRKIIYQPWHWEKQIINWCFKKKSSSHLHLILKYILKCIFILICPVVEKSIPNNPNNKLLLIQ